MRFILFAPYGAPANGVMAILKLDAIAARNLVLNNRALRFNNRALRWSAIYARMRCRGYGRRSHEQQCAGYREVSKSNHRVLPFVQADNIITPVTVYFKAGHRQIQTTPPGRAFGHAATSAVSAGGRLNRCPEGPVWV
jgi:hypothetical protein